MNTVTETEIKSGSKIKPAWKLSKVRAIAGKEAEKAIRIDLDYSSRSEYHWLPKSLIAAIEEKEDGTWAGDSCITLPAWFCIENGFVTEQ